MEYDDAMRVLVDCLRTPRPDRSHYGYELYLPNVISAHLEETVPGRRGFGVDHSNIEKVSPVFLAAAWDLCRMGILRPGIRTIGAQATADGASGNGYSVTPYGRRWLDQSEHLGFTIAGPDRFSRLVEPYRRKLGDGFVQRANEANRAYFAGAHLAACAMCGAAAESILLAVAIAKTGNESRVLSVYRRANGRREVQNILVGQAPDNVKRSISAFTDLLNYWRDEAAHGTASEIFELQAHEALARLLRFAQVATDRWDELTQTIDSSQSGV